MRLKGEETGLSLWWKRNIALTLDLMKGKVWVSIFKSYARDQK